MKATFKESDSRYPHGSLREQPEMEMPTKPEVYSMKFHGDMLNGIPQGIQSHNSEEWDAYELHCRMLRTIPCSENNWKDGQELEEGKDYQLVKEFFAWVAVPIVAQETEDELWIEVAEIIGNDDWYVKLPKLFFIQRRKQ